MGLWLKTIMIKQCLLCFSSDTTRWYRLRDGYQCHRCYSKEQHQLKREQRNANKRAAHVANPLANNKRSAGWRRQNPDARRESYRANRALERAQQKRYREQHRVYWLERLKKWRKENPQYHPQYNRANLPKQALLASLRRASVAIATPKWVDTEELLTIYRLCQEGYQVDHIHPIKHQNICGLNVPWNLQYLTASDNASKCNKFDGTYDNEGWMR